MILKVGIFRSGEMMQEALTKILELKERYKNIKVMNKGRKYNLDYLRALELDGMLELAHVITIGAIERKESRGSHSRLDYKTRDDVNFLKHTMATYTPSGPKISYSPVTITKYQPVERKY
jgi:succinate dehydrogenase / fumarate reductase flavoprotein subunit